jgi:transcriptional regulator with XRE-family HTH domain
MNNEETGTIGSRLKVQREKLGLSQAEVAEKAGITARSQRNYETGTRVPDAGYLIAVSRIGIDLVHVLHGGYGDRADHDKNDVAFIMAIEQAFGISHDDLAEAIDISLVDDNVNAFDPELLMREIRLRSPIVQAIIDRESGLDTDLLTGIFVGVDASLLSHGLKIESTRKAQAVAMLYRSFKASGKVDPAMIEEAVKLAAG